MAYGKIFESLYTGSMVGAGLNVFALWSYCIANAKPPGTIELNPVILATIFGCSVAEVNDAIVKLCAPDTRSRTKDQEGRRLLPEGEFLYFIPTWEKYNQMRNEVERRAANREYQRRWREKRKGAKPYESYSKQAEATSAHADVDVDVEEDVHQDPEKRARASARKPAARPDDVSEEVWSNWTAHRKAKKAPVTDLVLRQTRAKADAAGMTLEAALSDWVTQGYQGWFPQGRNGQPGRGRNEPLIPKVIPKGYYGNGTIEEVIQDI